MQVYEPLETINKQPSLSSGPDKQTTTGFSGQEKPAAPQKLEMSQSTTEFVALVGECK